MHTRIEDEDVDGFAGTDDAGVVTVVVDRSGVVTDVAVAQDWRAKVRPQELGLALGAAMNGALANRLADELTHVDLDPVVTPRRGAGDAHGNPSGAVARELKAEIAGLLAEFDRDLEAYRRELSETVNTTISARGPRGAVEVTTGHGQTVQVTVDPRWAKSAGHTDVRTEALGAFSAAAQRLATLAPRAVAPPASVVRLRELAADPRALRKELGLS